MKPGTDFWGTRVHARLPRMLDRDQLIPLCAAPTVPDLASLIRAPGKPRSAADLHRALETEWLQEIAECAGTLRPPEQRLMEWIRIRPGLEALKVLLRGLVRHKPGSEILAHLARLPDLPEPDLQPGGENGSQPPATPASAPPSSKPAPPRLQKPPVRQPPTAPSRGSRSHGEPAASLARFLPSGRLRDRYLAVLAGASRDPPLFLLEGAIDSGAFAELLARGESVDTTERAFLMPLLRLEADIRHLQWVLRGRFLHGQSVESIAALHVPGTAISHALFLRMLAAPDWRAATRLAATRLLDAPVPRSEEPGELATATAMAAVEALAWQRYRRLAKLTFRRSHVGIAAIAAYFCLRRLEVRDLTTVAEGIRMGVPPESLQQRFRTPEPPSRTANRRGELREPEPDVPPPPRLPPPQLNPTGGPSHA